MSRPTPSSAPPSDPGGPGWVPWAAGTAVLAVLAAGVWLGAGLVRDGGAGRPAPLGLTGLASGAEPGQAVLTDATNADGRHERLRLVGSLPDGPDSAAVHRLTTGADAAAVAGLAAAVSLPGVADRAGPRWELEDGARALRVATGPGALWTYARDAATACLPVPGAGPDEPVSCAAVAVAPAPAGAAARASAPDEATARAAAAPVLQAVGLDPADAVVHRGEADTRVRVDPVWRVWPPPGGRPR